MSETGKPSGGDMRERKITLPLLYVLDQSSAREREKLIAKLSNVRQAPENVDYLCGAAIEGGGIEYARKCMTEYKDKALTYLEGYPESDILRSLHLFAEFVLSRDK